MYMRIKLIRYILLSKRHLAIHLSQNLLYIAGVRSPFYL